jgi:hypothetical protein
MSVLTDAAVLLLHRKARRKNAKTPKRKQENQEEGYMDG